MESAQTGSKISTVTFSDNANTNKRANAKTPDRTPPFVLDLKPVKRLVAVP